MKVYEGGHAVMLSLPSASTSNEAGRLVSRQLDAFEGRRATAMAHLAGYKPHDRKNYHITFGWIGRDLTVDYAKKVIDAAWHAFANSKPIVVDLTGDLQLWSAGDVINLVAPAEPAGALLEARTKFVASLKTFGIIAPERWNPHVTLGSVPRKGPNALGVPPADPTAFECREVVVKYGAHRMAIELG